MAEISETPRQEVLRLWGQMTKERDEWAVSTWRDIANWIAPERGRYLLGSRPNDPKDFGSDIVNSTAGEALDTLASGVMSSLTNPARPWFRLTTADPVLSELGAVRGYLFQVERLVQWVFARSNIHNELHVCYRDLGSFGTAPLHIDDDPEDVIRAYVRPVGLYALGTSARQRVDSIGDAQSFTVRQLAQRFGEKKLCRKTYDLLKKRELNQRREVLHLILPNEDFVFGAYGTRGMRWRSVWMEMAADDSDGFLHVGGYRQFPTAAARWELVGSEDVYGYSKCRRVLPDVKQLQHLDSKKIELIDNLLAPPMQGPGGVEAPSLYAGAFSELPTGMQNAKIEPLYDVKPGAVQEGRLSVQELEMRIRRGLHEDLWRLLIDRDASGQKARMTATEVAQRHSEALTLLGPVVDRIHNELLSPLVRRTIAILAEKKMLPPPPRELVRALSRGEDVRIEYQSVLAQAQRLLGLGAIERFASIALALSGGDPNSPVWDKVDRDELLDLSADALAIPPTAIVPDDEVAQTRIARARAQRQAMQAQAMREGAETTKALSQAPMGQDSALDRLMQQYGPAAQGAIA